MLLNASYTTILNAAIADVTSVLTNFAADSLFAEKFTLAFGITIDSEQFLQIVAVLPQIEVRSDAELKGALGAFSAQTQKIYLSESLLKGDLVRLRSVLIEEIGHFVDAHVNQADSAGDEGAIFAAVVQGQSLDTETLQVLKAEDDSAVIIIAGENILVEQSNPNSPLINGLGGTAGFGENILDRNDDSSTGFIDVTSIFETGLNFFGTTYNGFYLNNNGNITFNSAQSTYTPFAITGNTSQPIIAPFFTDIDTRAGNVTPSVDGTSTGSNLVYWDLDPTNNQVTITWDDVGEYSNGTTPNAFQLILKDTGNGNFNIEFRYEDIQWFYGNARAGYSAGNGVNFFELPQSGTDSMLALETASNINQAGLYKFSVFSGTPVVPGILSFGATQFSVNEDGTLIAAVTVIRTEGSGGAISAKINFKDGTAKAPVDYTNTAITVNFAAGETSKTVNIPIVNDTLVEADETIQLILTNPTGGATIGTQNIATLTIVDNDSSLVITALPQGSTGSNKGQVTIAIAGQNLSPTDQISLISPTGTAKAASKVYWVNETEAWATFDLQGLTTGAYDVKVVNGSNSAVLNDRFSVTDGPLGNLNVQLSYPSQGVITLNYSNAGQTDLNAPLLRIVPTNAAITYPDAGTTSTTLKQLLNLVAATGEDSPSGILSPGESGEISFAFTPNGNGLISFAVQEVKPSDVINWASIKSESRADYSFIDSAGWDAIWTNLTASLGTTVGQFQAVMAENANYLSQLGQETNDLRRLFAFEWKQAVNTLTNVDLISTTDVVDAAPGLSLTFSRTFYQSIAERYNLGSLGRGWASQWDLRATTNSQGDVVIRSVGDLQRLFEKQTDGTFLDDDGAKVTITNGQYTLKESNGLVSFFGTDGKLNYVQDTNANRITLQYTNIEVTH